MIGFWPTAATSIAPTVTAMRTAAMGLISGRMNASSQAEERCDGMASVDMRRPIYRRRVARLEGIVESAHQASDLLDVGVVRHEIGHDAPAIDDEDAVREGEDLVDVRGDDEDGAPCIAHLDEYAVDRLDCADVDAARRLLGYNDTRAARQLARKLDLLLIAAGER